MSDAVFTRTYEVYTFLVSRQGRLSLYGLLNILQDASIAHAQLLGHGMRDTHSRHALWVLTRQKLRMTRWPQWNERIVIRTWVRPAEGAFAVRDFAIHAAGADGAAATSADGAIGELLGEATTSWLLLNAETRKPIRETITGFPPGTERCSFDAEKIAAPALAPAIAPTAPAPAPMTTALAQFTVRNSDIDSNQHVNNTRYAQWVLDAIPIERHAQYTLDEYSVNFLSETRLGDTIEIHNSGAYFHGMRVTDRKIVFTAQLLTHPS